MDRNEIKKKQERKMDAINEMKIELLFCLCVWMTRYVLKSNNL